MKKLLALILALTMLFALVAVSASAEDTIEISVMLPPWGEILDQSVIDAFTAETGIVPNITYLGWDSIHDKIVIASMSETAPADVMEVDWSWVTEFAALECLEPLDLSEEDLADFGPIVNFKKDGKVLAVPYCNDFRILSYNKDQYAQAGIDRIPETWKDLVEDCVKIKEAGIVEYPLDMPLSVSEGTSTLFMLHALSEYGPLFTEEGELIEEVALNVMNFYYDAIYNLKITDPACTNMIDQEVKQCFHNGNTTYDFAGPGAEFDLADQSTIVGKGDMMLIPCDIDGLRSQTIALPEAMGISAYSENKEAAMTFILWYNSLETASYLYDTMGLVPTRTSTLNKLNADGKIAYGDAIAEQSQYVTTLFPNGISSWYAEFSTVLANEINAVATGAKTPEQAVADAKTAAEELRAE